MAQLPSSLSTPSIPVLLGNHSGNKVTALPQFVEPFKKLEAMSRAGNYWATETIRAIAGLNSGHIKSNVFVESDGFGKFPEFTLLAPGIMIQFRKRANSDYHIFNMMVDEGFGAQQLEGSKPGLHRVNRRDGKVALDSETSGRVLAKDDRVVAVSDQWCVVRDAALSCEDAVDSSSAAILSSRYGFDMHYTKGERKIGGLRNIRQALNPTANAEILESAQLLAKTMMDAKSIKGVTWITEGGGAGIITQAMHIIKNLGFKFDPKEDKHFIYFHNITTNLVQAEQLARDIGLNMERKSKTIDYLSMNSVMGSGLGSGFKAAYYRYCSDPEKFTIPKLGTDLCKETLAARGAAGAIITVASGIYMMVGGNGKAALTIGTVMAVSSLVKSGLPLMYNKIKRWF